MSRNTKRKAEAESPSDTLAGAAQGPHIRLLIQNLSSPQAVERERSRVELVAYGAPAVPELLDALGSADERGRLEACKALAEIADPAAIPTLIQRLEDDHQDLRWVAAEGLLNIGGPAVEPLLLALIDRAWAHTILDGAVHVLRGLSRRMSQPVFEPVISAALRAPEPGVNVPPAAETALSTWREIGDQAERARAVSIEPALEPRRDKSWYDRRR
jgi:HEAT repeat protein